MTITEKAAYLKGLVEGQGMDPETGEGKLWNVLSELVGDLAAEVRDLRANQEELSDSVENVEIGLEYLEDLVQDDFDGDDDEDGDFEDIGYDDRGTRGDVYPFPGSSYDDSDDPEEPENGVEDDEEIYYEAECPGCGEIIEFDDETLEKGAIRCPGCGAMLRFDPDEPENPGEDAAADEAVDGPPEEDLPEE